MRNAFLLLLTLLFSAVFSVAQRQNTVVLTDSTTDRVVGFNDIAIFQDTTTDLDFSQVRQRDSLFRTNKIYYPTNLPVTSAFWVRTKVKDLSDKDSKWVLEIVDPHIMEVDVYIEKENGGFKHISSGAEKRFSSREYSHKNFVLDASFKKDELTKVYIRFKSDRFVSFHFNIRSNKYFSYYAQNEYVLLGMYYGIIVIMAIYNLFLFFTLKEKVYLYYVFYVISVAFNSFQEDGLGFQYIWPNVPGVSNFLTFMARPILMVSFVIYATSFLNLKKYIPLANYSVYILAGIFFVVNYIGYLISSDLSNYILFILPFIILYISSFYVWKKGYKPARYFILAYSILLLAVLIMILRDKGIIYNEFVPPFLGYVIVYSLNIGLITELVILSLALGDRIRFLKQDRIKSQQVIISQLRENEQLKDKVTRELEEKVGERTSQLKKVNQTLVNAKEEIELKNKNITDSIAYASRVYQAVIPDESNLKKQNDNTFLLNRPSDLVGGDFYFYREYDDYIWFGVADCTGHGVPGAFMSVLSYNLIQEILDEHHAEKPHFLLEKADKKVNDLLLPEKEKIDENYGLSLSCCKLYKKTLTLEVAGAMHPAVLVSANKLQEIKTDRFPLGLYMGTEIEKSFHTTVQNVSPNDMIYLFSDGYRDQDGGSPRQKFTKPRFYSLLNDISDLPPDNQKEHLLNAFINWKKDRPQIDDVIILGLRINPLS